ncbi:MAG: FMN-binding protein [Actinobacteria bacterium]|nr:FMN-binding protein [Actinomycetota bacterium]
MKRVVLTVLATVVGLVALLSFRTHGATQTAGGSGLPSATLPGAVAGSSTSPDPSPTSPATTTPTTSAPPDPSASASSTSRTATGSAITTRYGVVQVKVTVFGHTITNVAFAQLTAFDGRSRRINDDAAPILLQETLKAQSAKIDAVSGASYTSEGYIQSLQNALDQAGFR